MPLTFGHSDLSHMSNNRQLFVRHNVHVYLCWAVLGCAGLEKVCDVSADYDTAVQPFDSSYFLPAETAVD